MALIILVSVMVDITGISSVIAASSVVIGVIYYIFQLRHQSRVRNTDLVLRLYSTFGSEEFQQAALKVGLLDYTNYDDFIKKYGLLYSGEPVHMAITKVMYFFEGVGILLQRKLIDIQLVAQLFGPNIRWQWDRIKPLIESLRKQLNAPNMSKSFEYLYNEMKKREQKLQQSKG